MATNPDIFGQATIPGPAGSSTSSRATAEDDAHQGDVDPGGAARPSRPIWPGRITLGGVDLGDSWRHPLVEAPDATNGLVPFHKLSQWLSYSLIEPLEWAGLR